MLAPVKRLALSEPVEANAGYEIVSYSVDLPMRTRSCGES